MVVSKNQKIDFVVSWVNGQDSKWLEKYNKYSQQDTLDEKDARFRDYYIFKYWFRAVEKFAPWVNHIYLVTDNQIPEWLETNNPKLTVVDHKDIIPEEYLPVFNSSAIELNLANIDGLSEQFVYFNDDMFINKPVTKRDFFSKNGLPKDTAGLNAIQPHYDFDHIHVNNIRIINERYNARKVLKKQFFKFINPVNRELNIYTILLFFWPRFTRFFDLHYPYSLRKSEVQRVLQENKSAYLGTMENRFRSKEDITVWLVRYYSLVEGKFSVRSPRVGKIYDVKKSFKEAINDIDKSQHKLIVINDDPAIDKKRFGEISEKLKETFENKYPQKSSFEKED